MKPSKRLLAAVIAGAAIFWVLDRTYLPPVLMYHHVDERAQEWKLSVSPRNFERQMEFLKAHRYRVLSLSEYAGILKEKKPVPKKSVVITFDDGFDDNFSHAYPVLRKMGFPAVIFVQTDSIGAPGRLTAEDLAIMSENDVEIGSHTVTHAFLPDLSAAEIQKEVADSKALLEETLERPVTLFSYPGGGYTDEAARIVEETGYEAAVTTNRKGRKPTDPYAIRRIRISRTSDNLLGFWLKISGYYTWVEEWQFES